MTDPDNAPAVGRIGYRPPETPPKGKWARFLHAQHRKRGWNATQGFEALRAGLGLSQKSRTSYTDGLFKGKREPNEKEAAFLLAYFAPATPDDDPEPDTTKDEPNLASAIMALADELAAVRREREAWTRGVVAVLRSYGDGQVPVELLDALAPPSLGGAQQ